jgi:hypothetical protein
MFPDIGEQARRIGSVLERRLNQLTQQVTDLVRAYVDFHRIGGDPSRIRAQRLSIKSVVPGRSSHVGEQEAQPCLGLRPTTARTSAAPFFSSGPS